MQKYLDKCLSVVLMLALLLSVCIMSSLSAGAVTSGDYEYIILDDGTAEITKYNGNATELVIPTELDGNKVSSIGKFSFEKNSSITSLTIPSGITIGDNAFRYTKLKSLTLSDGVTTINNGAFSFCESLEQVTLPDSLTSIGNFAFQSCKSLKSIELPVGIERINDFAFTGCENLTDIDIPSNIKEIGQNTFAHCNGFKSIVIPEGVTLIDTGAFSDCENLTSVSLPETLNTINAFAFSTCLNLKEITVPDSVTEITHKALGYWWDDIKWDYFKVDGFVLKGYAGSAADRYAQENGIKFESIGISQQPATDVPTAPTEPTEPPVPGTVVTVYFKNTSNFSAPYAYYWPNGGKGPISWPGVAMTKVTDDIYKVDVPAGNNMIIFSDNGNNKIGDLEMGANNQIYDGGWKDYEDAPTAPTTEPAESTVPTTEPAEPTAPTTEPESELSDYIYGDVNIDGDVNVKDATEIQRAAAFVITLNDLQKVVADVNKDGDESIRDATEIQKFAAGFTVKNAGERVPVALLPKEI